MSHKCNYVGCLSSSFSTCAQATSNFLPDVVSCRGQEFIADFRAEQPIVFGCIDYYTTSCTFDATTARWEPIFAGYGRPIEASADQLLATTGAFPDNR